LEHRLSQPDPYPSAFVFIGDSVTDADRQDPRYNPLGHGYVRLIADQLDGRAAPTITNLGVSGSRVRDVKRRWEDAPPAGLGDCLTILVGINDTWRRFDNDDPTSASAFEADYRSLIEMATRFCGTIVLMEPFLLPVRAEQTDWLEDLGEKIDVVHRLADEYGTLLVALHARLNRDAETTGMPALSEDGVHPTPRGHARIAHHWLECVQPSVTSC
jgi:lysophospholipase L1-like esterase